MFKAEEVETAMPNREVPGQATITQTLTEF